MISILQALLVVDLGVIATANEDELEDSNLDIVRNGEPTLLVHCLY
jgi:hypothetical protein